jgi:hypothetical protein
MKCFCKRVSGRELIVSKETFDKYVKLKRWFLTKRIFWAVIHSISALLATLLYYLDIVSDINLSIEYFQNEDYYWSLITILIVFISLFVYWLGMMFVYAQNGGLRGFKRQIIWKWISIIIPLEILNW